MFRSITAPAAAGLLLFGLTAHSGVAEAQRWDGWHGFGWGGGDFRGAILPGVGWAGGWGGRGGWGRPEGWGQPWGWSYYRMQPRPHAPRRSASVGGAEGWPDASSAGYGACRQLRRVRISGVSRRRWENVCVGWGGDGDWSW